MGKTPSGGMGPWGNILGKRARQQTQSDYASLGMLLQIKWQYLQTNVPGVGTMMGPIDEALSEKFSPALFRGEEINADFWQILGHSVNNGGLGITEPWL